MSSRLRVIAGETLAIIERGSYRGERGVDVSIAADVARAVAGTRLYRPDDPLPAPPALPALPAPLAPGSAARPPRVEVTNESSLAATRRLGGDVACLVFASARNPGGGFRNGAEAQEESLARSSALYPCLNAAWDFYSHHRTHPELTYSDRVIYSPAVPVFRDDTGALLPRPYPVTFLTAAAPNRSAMVAGPAERLDDLPELLRRRAARVLGVAGAHGHRRLVLGAWGCGVFGNDPTVVAEAFAAALRRHPDFDHVVFAVLDRHRDTATYRTFARLLAPGVG